VRLGSYARGHVFNQQRIHPHDPLFLWRTIVLVFRVEFIEFYKIPPTFSSLP
jgi:hypothetical protein